MKLYFAEAYTLKEDNWAAEIIGYSAEQLPNNEPSRSCPKNRQDRLKEKGPHRGRIINRYQVSSDRSSERFPVRRGRDIGQAPFLLRGNRGIQGFMDSPSSGCTGSRQTTEYRELLPALLRPPNPVSEGDRRDGPLRERASPSVVEAISGSCGGQKKVRSYDLTLKRRLPTLPRENRSTIGVSELNFSVRNGKRWNLTAITT